MPTLNRQIEIKQKLVTINNEFKKAIEDKKIANEIKGECEKLKKLADELKTKLNSLGSEYGKSKAYNAMNEIYHRIVASVDEISTKFNIRQEYDDINRLLESYTVAVENATKLAGNMPLLMRCFEKLDIMKQDLMLMGITQYNDRIDGIMRCLQAIALVNGGVALSDAVNQLNTLSQDVLISKNKVTIAENNKESVISKKTRKIKICVIKCHD